MATRAKRFTVDRNVDAVGVSGTGVVADGVLWPDGAVTIRWRNKPRSTVNWDSIEDAHAVHSHDGATEFVWQDVW